MADLSHWDFADSFKPKEAAALILGVEPDSLEKTFGKAAPIYSRMKSQYLDSLNSHSWMILGGGDSDPDRYPFNEKQLSCLATLTFQKYEDTSQFAGWLEDRNQNAFEKQQFSRQELARWLTAIGMKSTYQFVESPARAEKQLADRERSGFLNIVGAMLELLQSPRDGRGSDAAVIRELVENYSDKYGISKSSLENKFAEAKRSLKAN